MSLCVYALIPATRARVSVTGVAGEPLRTITVGRVTAVIGEMRRAPTPSTRQIRRYASIVAAIAERAPAVLPARFGTCVIDREELEVVLRARQEALLDLLRSVRGRVQMTLRFVTEPQRTDRVPARRVVRGRPTPRQGTAYLRQRAAAAVNTDDIAGFDAIHNAVRRWIRGERIERRAGVATVNHLIARSAASSYRAALERETARVRARPIVTGPWPPFAFAVLDE